MPTTRQIHILSMESLRYWMRPGLGVALLLGGVNNQATNTLDMSSQMPQ